MKTLPILFAMAAVGLGFTARAQTESPNGYRNFPIIVTLQFHSLSLPFHNIRSNFSNVGLGLGTEVSLNGKHNWAQQVHAVWIRNKNIGNGLLLYSQAAWRPAIVSKVYTEVKAGAGYLHAFRPVESYKQSNGKWMPVSHQGKGMLVIPVGVSLGYNKYSTGTYVSPFVSYQFMLVNNYNASIPIVPQTLLQVGSRIHLK